MLQEHNETLINAEAEKQQALSMKEAEKAALQEKLNNATQQIHDLGVECDKLKRQAAARQEKDRVSCSLH